MKKTWNAKSLSTVTQLYMVISALEVKKTTDCYQHNRLINDCLSTHVDEYTPP